MVGEGGESEGRVSECERVGESGGKSEGGRGVEIKARENSRQANEHRVGAEIEGRQSGE